MLHLPIIFLVCVLGLKHGLDADHLAYIDGQTRYHWRLSNPMGRWVGSLFSFGHSIVVVGVAVLIGILAHQFRFPAYFNNIATWVSVVTLTVIGSFNVYYLLQRKAADDLFRIRGMKGGFLPKLLQETANPFVIVLVGGLFALAADTVSQTSMWSLAAGHSSRWMPAILGFIFMFGMMTTDTLDSLITYQMVSHSNQLGQAASRFMGWMIVFLSYGVSLYEVVLIFAPQARADFETIGILAFACLFVGYTVQIVRSHRIRSPITK